MPQQCPKCDASIADDKFNRHLAMHNAPAPIIVLEAPPAARYTDGCEATGTNIPEKCKHGKCLVGAR